MIHCLCAFLAAVSIWEYPARFNEHSRLRRQFVAAARSGDTAAMASACRKGVELLPEDPTWRYNLACSLAYFKGSEDEAFDELKKAIDYGFRDCAAIASDTDLKRLEKFPRYKDMLAYAERMKDSAVTAGPMAAVEFTGTFGTPVTLGPSNVVWNFDFGCFDAKMKLAPASSDPWVGDLYVNRDGGHSYLNVKAYPGITPVRFSKDSDAYHAAANMANTLYPYPVFGNCSRAWTTGPYWRSIPRMMTTMESSAIGRMVKFYLSNQTWVYPANADIAPIGTNGDVFASIAPYWMTTAGRSWSDLPYLRAALDASRAFHPNVKAELVRRGLLAPTIQTIIRKSLKGVKTEADYLTARAHPTALPPNGVESARLKAAAKALAVEAIPPLAVVSVAADPVDKPGQWPELTYGSAFAWAYVLRADQLKRVFTVTARGAEEFAFVKTHGSGIDVKIEKLKPNVAKVTIDRRGMSPTNRVDITVVGRNRKTGWGAPSYVCFARMDPSAPYSDPGLTPARSTVGSASAGK
ncbi:MAG: hypothetical protein J6T01_02400 [Kiritimatiellae bacterium]|nr:hypothetical protein [Kiritimatiellia bacterium]